MVDIAEKLKNGTTGEKATIVCVGCIGLIIIFSILGAIVGDSSSGSSKTSDVVTSTQATEVITVEEEKSIETILEDLDNHIINVEYFDTTKHANIDIHVVGWDEEGVKKSAFLTTTDIMSELIENSDLVNNLDSVAIDAYTDSVDLKGNEGTMRVMLSKIYIEDAKTVNWDNLPISNIDQVMEYNCYEYWSRN